MVKINDLMKEVHDNTLRCRSIEAIVHSGRFERLWRESTVVQQQRAELAIWRASKKDLVKWMNDHDSLELGERPITYLRSLAQKLRVRNYSRLSKSELIGEISRKEKVNEPE